MTRKARKRALVLATAATLATLVAPTPSVGASGASPVAPRQSTESPVIVEQFAAERGISVQEASTRLSWQEDVQALNDQARSRLGSSYGGTWIDVNDGDRIKVGVVGATSRASSGARAAIGNAGLDGAADIVQVEHSISELNSSAEWLGGQLASLEDTAEVPLSAGLRTDLNSVVLHVPAGGLSAAQQGLVDRATSRLGDQLVIQEDAQVAQSRACSYVPQSGDIPADRRCDPPLRAGVRIQNDSFLCTAGFPVRSRSDGALFILTNGHCNEGGRTWGTNFTNGTLHTIGNLHRAIFSASGDMAIIRVNNPAGWNTRAWVNVTAGPQTTVNEQYPIRRDGGSTIGMRICTTGGLYPTSSCGNVTELGHTADIGGVIVRGLGRGTFCGMGGDSGSPMFGANTAYGLQNAGYAECDSLYQGISGVERLLNVNVSHSP